MLRAAAIACLLAILSWNSASAAESVSTAGLQPLSDQEMSDLRGGFATPGGLLVAVGLQVAVTTEALSGDQPGLAASATLARIDGDPAIVNLVQYGPAGVAAIVQNSLNNVMLRQVTQLNIDIANYSRIQAQQMSLGPVAGSMIMGLPR